MSLDDIDLETRTQEILLAASNHDLNALKPFLRMPGAASLQDPETGFTPLHAAIAACGQASPSTAAQDGTFKNESTNTATNSGAHELELVSNEGDAVDIEKAKATVRELFLSGAIWNDLDVNNETPGCLAWRLGQKELYELVVEAGVRAELLMNLMGGYEQLPDEDSDEEETEEEMNLESEDVQPNNAAISLPNTPSLPPINPDSTLDQDVTSEAYLASHLTFTKSKLLDSSSNGVMMSWETPIMSLTAQLLAPTSNLRILNIGFGLGIIDRLFAATRPAAHHIIEAHPDVLARLHGTSTPSTNTEAAGEPKGGGEADSDDNFAFFGPAWQGRNQGANVIHAGRWQDVVPTLLEREMVFDVIYFDTFGEDYGQLKTFFTEHVVGLLAPEGRFGFFNGLGADRKVCYDVYTRVVECDLLDAGFDVEWVDVDVDMAKVEGEQGMLEDAEGARDAAGRGRYRALGTDGEGEWKGVRRRYWTLEKYRLPICRFLG